MRFLRIAPYGVGGSAARSDNFPHGRWGRAESRRGFVPAAVEGLEARVLFANVDVTLSSNTLIIDSEQLSYLPTLRVFDATAIVTLSGDNLQVSTTPKGDQMVTGQVSAIDDIQVSTQAGGRPGVLFREPATATPFTIQGFHAAVPLVKVDLGDAHLTGDVNLAGGASSINWGDGQGLTFHAGTGAGAPPVLRITNSLVDSKLTIDEPVKSFTAGSYTSSTPGTSLFVAPSVNLFRVPGSMSADLMLTVSNDSLGNFVAGTITGGKWQVAGNASLITVESLIDARMAVNGNINRFSVGQNINNTTLSTSSIGTFKVGGDIDGGVFVLHQPYDPRMWNLNRMTVGGQVKNTLFFSDGNINSVTADALDHTEFYCGVKTEVTDILPADPANAFGQEVLFRVLRLKRKDRPAMVQSVLVAAHFGNIDLGMVQIPGSGQAQGISTKSILRLIMLLNGKKITLKNLLKIPNLVQELEDAGLTLDTLRDFAINLPQF